VNAVAARRGVPAAWWGMAMLVAAEGTLLTVFVATYFYLRFKNVTWPPAGIPEPRVVLPLLLAGVLVLTSGPMQLASASARRGRLGVARASLLLVLLVELGYLAVALWLYQDDLGKFTPREHAYGSIYYTLLGADHAHVLVAALLNAWVLVKLVGGLTRYRMNALLAATFYVHAVNVLTVVITLTIVSPAL
jgi:heme/copper-type cytochrome/quinol oxidase subunit 3